jgi:soluble lytic murein transglycosylase-like protein
LPVSLDQLEEELLRFVQESGGAPDRWLCLSRSLVLAAIGVLMIAGSADARMLQQDDAASRPTADTSRIHNPIHFRKTVLFTPDYLARVAENASNRRSEEAAAAARAESAAGAAPFARRYGVSNDLAQKIYDAALAEGIDPDLGFRLVRVESRFNTRARGPRGALGLAQLMPSTARALDRSLRTEAQILDPTTNLRLGFGYLRRLIDRYDGDVRLGLLAYNRGSGTVDRVLRNGGDPENGYSRKVLGSRAANAYQGPGRIERAR